MCCVLLNRRWQPILSRSGLVVNILVLFSHEMWKIQMQFFTHTIARTRSLLSLCQFDVITQTRLNL